MPTPAALNIQPSDASWREAASLIILAEDSSSNQLSTSQFDYSILMVKRSGGSSFMASAFVFPGGQLEQSDFDPKWYQLFDSNGMSRSQLDRVFTEQIVGPRPPIVNDTLTLKKLNSNQQSEILNPNVALRISAIRETFEEAGILLLTKIPELTNPKGYSSAIELTQPELVDWQLRVRNSANTFYDLCEHLGMAPNIWSLYEWSDWLTPVSVGHRRFDTIFYICALGAKPVVRVDNAEVTKPIWCNPVSILEEHRKELVFLAPPQVYELSRMLNYKELERFHRYIKARQVLGTDRWLPVMLTYDDGSISVLPGDERYPTEPELVCKSPYLELSGSVDDINRESKHKNRIDLRGIQSRALCTIEPGCGHLPPITYEENFKFPKEQIKPKL